MLAIKDLNGEVYLLTGASNIVRKRRVNGEKELALRLDKTAQNARFFDDIEKLWRIIDFNGDEYPILLYRDVAIGNGYQREFSCLHSFFDDMRNHVIYESFTGSKTFDAMMQFIFNNSGYTYDIIGTFYSERFENFGDDYGLELFKDALDRYQAEFKVKGNNVSLRTQIGNVTDFQYRHKFNLESIERNVDAIDFSTYGEGFGKDGLHVVYRSPLADIYGERPIKAIRDERFTIEENLREKVKEAVDSTLKVTLTVKLSDLRTSGYNKNHPDEGDTIILVDDRLDLKVDVRIVEIIELLDKKGNVIDCDVTLSNFSNVFEQQRRMHKATKTIADAIEGKRPLPFEALSIAVQQATIALQNAQTELHFPDNGGILAISKDNPNHLVLFNSNGLGISVDGGQTFKSAITGEGIVADVITAGFFLADRIKGGTLTLGGDVNGRMILLNENNETVAVLDAGLKGFSELYVGDLTSPTVVRREKVNVTYYVNPFLGDDTNDGLTETTALKSISAVLNRLPLYLEGQAKIMILGGSFSAPPVFYEDLSIRGFVGNGTIEIEGTEYLGGVLEKNYPNIIGKVEVFGNIAPITLKKLQVKGEGGDIAAISSHQNKHVLLSTVRVDGNNGLMGIDVAYSGHTQIENCNVIACQNAISSRYGATAYVSNTIGTGVYGLYTNGGFIVGSGFAPKGTMSNVLNEHGGQTFGTFDHSNVGGGFAPPKFPLVASFDTVDYGTWDSQTNTWLDEVSQGRGNKGLWIFDSDLTTVVGGKTVKGLSFPLKRKEEGGNAGEVEAVIRLHSHTTKPTGEPDYLPNYEYRISFKWGEEKTIYLPASFFDAFENGQAKGIMIYTENEEDFMKFDVTTVLQVRYD